MAERKKFGNNKVTIRLCANCHDLFHLIKNKKDLQELGMIVVSFGGMTNRLIKIKELINESILIEEKIFNDAKTIRSNK